MLGLVLLGLGPVQEKLQAQAQRQLQVRLVRLVRLTRLTRREPQEQQELRARQEERER